MRFTKRWMDIASWLLVVVCAACCADRGGAPSHSAQAPRTINLSATPVSPEVFHPPGGAGTAPAVVEAPKKRSCTTDPECAPDFCDRGVCATPGKALYGREECEPDPPPPPTLPPPPPGMKWAPKAGFPADECSAYLCIDGRCRSCASDAECGEGLACKSESDFPGRRCGRPGPDERPAAKKPQPKPPPMPPMLGVGAEHPPDPSGRQILIDPSQFPPPPPPPKPSQ
jgi:hypothetical protein